MGAICHAQTISASESWASVASIALSWGGAFGALTEMEPTEAEKLKARRTQLLLCWLVAVMITAPVLIVFLRSR
jgi:hypothetical protein